MSIRLEWQRLVGDGEYLWSLAPFSGDPAIRTVLLCEEMNELFAREMEEGKEANRRSRLLATLHHIVAGKRVVVCMDPYEAREAHMGRLDDLKDGVWDIRCRGKPGLRVFCQFLEKDVLLTATCRPRSKIVNWLGWFPLGERNSKEWKRGIAAIKREWQRLFPTYEPLIGDNLDDYLSNATLE
jgi:hypothetical protein